MHNQKKSIFRWNMKKLLTKNRINTRPPTNMSWTSSPRNDCVFSGNGRFEGWFFHAISPFLIVGQCFGVMPVKGVRGRSTNELGFKWNSPQTMFSVFIGAILILYFLLVVWETFSSLNTEFTAIAVLIFYGSNTYGYVRFFVLATKWPELMHYWTNIETKSPTFKTSVHRRNFVIKIRFLSLIILIFALIEHLLSVGSMVHFIMACQRDKDPVLELVKADVPYILKYVHKISIWEAVCYKLISVCATFIWNFLDVFIIIVSIGLSMMFKLFNNELNQASSEHHSQNFWMYRRAEYGRLCALVNMVDKEISQIILLSFSNNLFFTCKQLYQSLSGCRPLPTIYRVVYFWYSLLFLIMRAFVVSFSAACVNDESKKPINILRVVPSNAWNTETKRFYDEVVNDMVALSGMRFFFLTRRLILGVAGTVVTYEIILMQFHLNYSPTATCNNV